MQGYCAVVIPRKTFYQGFFISDQFAHAATKLIELAQKIVTTGVPGSPEARPEVRHAAPAVGHDMAKQMMCGALSAVLVDRVTARDLNGISAAAYALSKVSGDRFFVVTGYEDASGTRTEYEKLEVDTVDQARTAIESKPMLMVFKAMAGMNRESS